MKKKKSDTDAQSIAYVPVDRNPEYNSEVIPLTSLNDEETFDFIQDPEDWPDEHKPDDDLRNGNGE